MILIARQAARYPLFLAHALAALQFVNVSCDGEPFQTDVRAAVLFVNPTAVEGIETRACVDNAPHNLSKDGLLTSKARTVAASEHVKIAPIKVF